MPRDAIVRGRVAANDPVVAKAIARRALGRRERDRADRGSGTLEIGRYRKRAATR